MEKGADAQASAGKKRRADEMKKSAARKAEIAGRGKDTAASDRWNGGMTYVAAQHFWRRFI